MPSAGHCFAFAVVFLTSGWTSEFLASGFAFLKEAGASPETVSSKWRTDHGTDDKNFSTLTTQQSKIYTDKLRQHYEDYFGISGQPLTLEKGPKEKLHPDFYVLEFKPNGRHDFWTYCSVGMSLDRNDDNLIEVFVFSPRQDLAQVELITVCASYHRNGLPLNLNHTINIGRPWLDNSKCDHCFISLPYLDGEVLELFNFGDKTYHCYWLIPITEKERDFKVDKGSEALEQLFEDKQLDYLKPDRKCLLTN